MKKRGGPLFEKGALMRKRGGPLFEKGALMRKRGGPLFERGAFMKKRGGPLFERDAYAFSWPGEVPNAEVHGEITIWPFPPGEPGHGDDTIVDPDGKSLIPTIELEVDKLYWGAVRFGLGALFDVGNVWKTQQILTFAGSRQQEIAQYRSGLAFEVVTGFAPYLFDLMAWGGRSETVGGNTHTAPYIGFGVVSAAPNQGVTALSSVHMGLEAEFGGSFSIATTFVMRRSRGLLPGYAPGSPVNLGTTTDAVTKDSWLPGFGIVVNASPSFLQFATGSPSPTNSGTAPKMLPNNPPYPPAPPPAEPPAPSDSGFAVWGGIRDPRSGPKSCSMAAVHVLPGDT